MINKTYLVAPLAGDGNIQEVERQLLLGVDVNAIDAYNPDAGNALMAAAERDQDEVCLCVVCSSCQ